MDVRKAAEAARDYLVSIRREFHQHPELSMQEFRTAQRIEEELDRLGIPHTRVGETGVLGTLRGEKEGGRAVVLRADIDALPIEETHECAYRSQNPGVMHACGHDTHAACLLVLARILSEHPELVKGTVKFIFQAAEEKLPGGAKALCADHALDGVDMVFGMHSSSNHPLGTITLSHSSSSAAIGIYEVTIHGKGGHGSAPHNAKNPVPVACLLASALNQILAEKKAPADTGVFTVSYINGGQYPNIITDTVTLGGNIRTQDNALIQQIFGHIDSISHGICEAHGMTCDVTTTLGYPATINTPEYADVIADAADTMGYTPVEESGSLGGEDFAYFLMEKPGAYFHVGMADPDRPITSSPHHNCNFQLDERGLAIALEMELALYLKLTKQDGE